jgi:Tol biopolymer transport system component
MTKQRENPAARAAGSPPRPIPRRPINAVVAALVLAGVACSDPAAPNTEVEERLLFLSTRDGALDQLGRPMREIYLMTSDGSGPVNLTQQPSTYLHLSLSPDGRRVVFASQFSGCDIWMMNTDGSELQRLTGQGANEGCNAWPRSSPDGARVAFASNRDGRQIGSTSGLYDVWVMNADGSDPRNVSHSLGAELGFDVHVIGWSPAGQVVFETGSTVEGSVQRRVYVVNADGTGMQPLFERTGDYAPAWSPDGSRIAFISERDGRRRLYVMNADGTGAIALTNHDGDDRLPPGCCGLDDNVFARDAWSSDGKRIAFERFASPEEWGTIYTIGADGTGLRRIVDFSASFNGWSPSGTRIALTRRDGSMPADIYVVDADGSDLRNVTNSPSEDSDALWVDH